MSRRPLGSRTYLEHFRARVLQDALAEATATYWLQRAEACEQARPKPGDYTGQAGNDELATADQRCADTAQACRSRAEFARMYADEIPDDVWTALEGEAV